MRTLLLGCALLAACARVAPEAPTGAALRVVAIGPGTEANLFALGLGGRLVGVSDFCTVVEAAMLPRVGGQSDPNLERIAALVPDLVLVQGQHPRLAGWCADSSVGFHAFPTDSLAGWKVEVRWLGQRFGVSAESDRLITTVERALMEMAPFAKPRRTLLVVARRADEASGILAAGRGTFLSELLAAAGGVNVLPEGSVPYPSINEETLIRLDPETVLEFRPSASDDGSTLQIWKRGFPELTAVRTGRVGIVTHTESLIPGPRMHEVAREMRAWLR